MSLVKMLLLISLLIIVHELGHFLVARAFKIKVSKFGIGLPFGPTLFEKKIGDVVFAIHLLLFGGYVSFPDDEKDNDLPKDSPELFRNKPIYQRACVISAGVIANLIMAYLIVVFCCFYWHKLPLGQYDVYVNNILPKSQIAKADTDIKIGDKIAFINGKEVLYPNELRVVAQESKNCNGKITPKHFEIVYNKLLKLNSEKIVVNSNMQPKKGQKILLPKFELEDNVVLTNSDIFGLNDKSEYILLSDAQKQLRDKLKNKKSYVADGEFSLKDIATAIADTYSPIVITVERDGKLIDLKPLSSGDEGSIGLELVSQEKMTKIDSVSKAFVSTNKYMVRNTQMMFWSLEMLFTGKVPLKEMRGIVAITKIGSDVIEKQGLLKGLLLTALISLNLAILNILPIPALDGGHLIFLTIEKIKGSPVDEKFVDTCSTVFFFILIAFMIVIVGSDIWAISHKMI